MNTAKSRLGANIRRRREEIGLTQAALAEAVGMSDKSIGFLERGKVWPEFENLELIASHLKTTPDELLASGKSSPAPTPKGALEILAQALEDQEVRIHELEAKLAQQRSVEAEIRSYLPANFTDDHLRAIKRVCDGFKTAQRLSSPATSNHLKKNRA